MTRIIELVDMLNQGKSIQAHHTTASRFSAAKIDPLPTTINRSLRDGKYAYFITDHRSKPNGITMIYSDPWIAARTFVECVGWVALSTALSENRYQHLFPLGSTLEWHARKEHQARHAA